MIKLTLKRDIAKIGRDIIPLRTVEKIPKWIPKITQKVLTDRVKVAKIIKTIQSKAIARGQRKPTDYQSLTDYVRKLTGASPAKVSRYLRKLPQWKDKAIAYDKRKNVHLEMYKKWCVFKRSTLDTPEGTDWSDAKKAVRDRMRRNEPENPIEIDILRDTEKKYEDKYAIRCYDDPDEYAEQRDEGMWYH